MAQIIIAAHADEPHPMLDLLPATFAPPRSRWIIQAIGEVFDAHPEVSRTSTWSMRSSSAAAPTPRSGRWPSPTSCTTRPTPVRKARRETWHPEKPPIQALRAGDYGKSSFSSERQPDWVMFYAVDGWIGVQDSKQYSTTPKTKRGMLPFRKDEFAAFLQWRVVRWAAGWVATRASQWVA